MRLVWGIDLSAVGRGVGMSERLAVSPLGALALGGFWFLVTLSTFAAFVALGAGVWG